MRDQDFEKTMDAWAAQEIASAPEMRPTADMVRMVRAKRQRKPISLFRSRWATVGAAVAGLVVVAILYAALFHPSILFDLTSRRRVALVGQREGSAYEKVVMVRTPVSPRGKGEPISFRQLMVQIQRQDSRFVEGVDLRAPPEERIALALADNYRLLLEPAEDRYVYVFQRTSLGILVQLFPNETYSSVQNPLRRGQMVYLPSEPNWLYLGEGKGEERLHVIASTQPLRGVEGLYTRYSQTDDKSNKQETLTRLLERLDTIQGTRSEKAAGWVFVFDHE